MSVWTEFEGSISFHDSEHISVYKALKEFFEGREVLFGVSSSKINEHCLVKIWCNMEESVEESIKLFTKFLDIVKNTCKYPKHFNCDISVSGRIFK